MIDCPTKTPGTCHVCKLPAISDLYTICRDCKPTLLAYEWENECFRAQHIQIRDIANILQRERY